MPVSENTRSARLDKLKEVSLMILEGGNAHSFIINNRDFIPAVIPSDFITLFDELVKQGYDMQHIKVLTNKVLNIFHLPIKKYNRIEPKPESFLWIMEKNNHEMEIALDSIRPVFKAFVRNTANTRLRAELSELFNNLAVFINHYYIIENVLSPVIEEAWPDYRCMQIMWSFHDDIRQNLKKINTQLHEDPIDLKSFNRCVGDVFFNMLAMKFREEHILYPQILSSLDESILERMKYEAFEIGYPYIQPKVIENKRRESRVEGDSVDLGTGNVSIEQIRLIFNHLPVDITFVNENNKVCYFSSPKERIFPRTNAIIGRDVQNCHPPESVHIVEKIIESFRTGQKEKADFRINMKGKMLLIQYFAVRDEQNNYKGVIEVSQEISEIKALEGEKRLLDW